ncbi:sigma-70 family RNA polymerase sigma factor [Victivallis vadensis]|uniref:Sigma-70 family RNA polymerase sigma factor n=1 Tax=Victivallis vadensis TaxID=172901 RepID=A0A848AUM4_9BACT|nr:sigma-70 family RNA polymerase sigma factor [Victivallis vadensis]NMD85300.1 sigma-70 family RNA polymerase sigma factor [Victivallis vadensis]
MGYTTKKSLLEAICSGDEVSWHEFYEIYRPLIVVRGRDYKLNVAEIDELVQSVMLRFFDRSKSFVYDRSKGKFRDYLGVMIYHCALNIIRQRCKNEVDCEAVELEAYDHDRWQEEWRQHILTLAMKQLKLQLEDSTFQAFEFYAVKGESAAKVAKFLKIPVNMVYVAKSRALAKLRKIVNQLREEE